jgi:hypothetical protein
MSMSSTNVKNNHNQLGSHEQLVSPITETRSTQQSSFVVDCEAIDQSRERDTDTFDFLFSSTALVAWKA